MTKTLKDEFWDRMDDVQAGMLEAENTRIVPMSHYADKDEGVLWFIIAAGTEVETAAHGSARATHVVADPRAHIYAKVAGTLTEVKTPKSLTSCGPPWPTHGSRAGRTPPTCV